MPEHHLTPPKEDSGDHLHMLARAGIASIPLVGGAAVELFNTIIAPPIVKRRNEWMEEVAKALQKLADEEKITLDTLKDDPALIQCFKLRRQRFDLISRPSVTHYGTRS
jgi:hypothetical protein